MRGSITIAKVFDTKVRMHLTFLLLLAWVAAVEGAMRGPHAAVSGILFVLLLFACVVAHEFGHILVARHYGGRTRDILLLPIGGISRMERMPEGPTQELAVAVAGPAVSIAIGIALMMLVGAPTTQSVESPAFAAILPRLAAANIFLAIFNLLPAFPMDGGRALRALLAMRMGRVRATKTAATMGHFIAGLFVLWGLVSPNPLLLLIGIFIYFGASAESADTELRELARTLTVADVMRSNLRPIAVDALLADAVTLMLHAGQHAIPVFESDGTLAGIATKESIIRALHRSGRGAAISEALERGIPIVASKQRLAEALELMQGQSAAAVVVVDSRGEFVGMLTPETIADIMLARGLAEKPQAPAPISHARISVPSSV